MDMPARTLGAEPLAGDHGHRDRCDIAVHYQEHHDRLVRLLTMRTGDRAVAEDLAQDTFLRLMDRLDSLERPGELWPWLRTVAMNLATDRDRRETLDGAPRQMGGEVLLDLPAVDRDDVEALVDQQVLLQALQQLSTRHRQVLLLHYLSGWQHADIGRLLGLGPAAVRQLLARARGGLCAAYRRLGEGPGMRGLVPWPLLWIADRTRAGGHRIRRWSQEIGLPGQAGAGEAVSSLAVALTLVAGGAGLAGILQARSAEAGSETRPAISSLDAAATSALIPTTSWEDAPALTTAPGAKAAAATPAEGPSGTPAPPAGHAVSTAIARDDVQPVDALADAKTEQDDDALHAGVHVGYSHGDGEIEQGVVEAPVGLSCGTATGGTICAVAEPVNSVQPPS